MYTLRAVVQPVERVTTTQELVNQRSYTVDGVTTLTSAGIMSGDIINSGMQTTCQRWHK